MNKLQAEPHKNKKIYLKYDVLFICLLFLGLGLYIYRLPYGMADVDETFYLSVPYRLCQGDALIVDEWHVSQLAGFLLYPFMWLYLKAAHTTEGIVLAFRWIYLVFQLAAATGIYCILRRYRLAAAGSAILFFIFSPFNIMALSYNSLGLAFVLLFSLLLVAVRRPSPVTYMLSGICCACGVLCNPYFAGIFVLYILVCCIYACFRQKRALACFQVKSALWVLLGTAIMALLFFFVLLSRASLSDVLRNLPNVLTDPAHPAKTFHMVVQPIMGYAKTYALYVVPALALPFLGAVDQNQKRRGFYLAANIILSVGMTCYFALFQTKELGMNAVMLPFSSIGITAYTCTPRVYRKQTLLLGWLIGVLYGVCMVLSSNQYMYVASNALVVSDVFAVLMLSRYFRYSTALQTPLAKTIPLLTLLILQLSAQVYVKTHHVFWDNAISELTQTVDRGPVKGLRTTPYRVRWYEQNLEDLDRYLPDVQGKRVHFFRNMPYAYLYTNAKLGTSSAWGTENLTLDSEKLELYYAEHPENIPEYIYVEAYVAGQMEDAIWHAYGETHGYQLEILPSGALLYTKE